MFSNGNFVVAWNCDNSGNGIDVCYRIFDSTGAPLTDDLIANTFKDNNQQNPVAYFLPDNLNRFIIVWESYGQDSTDQSSGIFAQMFAINGAKIGKEFQVNTITTGDQIQPAVAGEPNGNFVISWTDSNNIFIRRFGSNMKPIGEEFLGMPNDDTKEQSHSSLTFFANGDFGVVYQSNSDNIDGDGFGIRLVRFDFNGAQVGFSWVINRYYKSDQTKPQIVSLPTGGFMVIWESEGEDDYGSGIIRRIFK